MFNNWYSFIKESAQLPEKLRYCNVSPNYKARGGCNAFHLDDPKQMRQYVKNHHAFPYAVYVADPRHPEIFEDCVIRGEPRKGEELLWKFPDDDKHSYLECIVRTEYAYSDQNDLPEHIGYMRKQGIDPG